MSTTNLDTRTPSDLLTRLCWAILSCVLLGSAFWPAGGNDSGTPVVAATIRSDAPAYQLKKIEDIRVGDLIVARDEQTGEISSKPVVRTFRRRSDHLQILSVTMAESGESQTIETTDEHPFWVIGTGWVKAKTLAPGDELFSVDGSVATVESNHFEPHATGVPVFNSEVADLHTYHVRANGTRGPPVLVHNTCNFVSLDDVVASAQALKRNAPVRTSIPGDADFVGPVQRGWRLSPEGMGAHLVERVNVSGRSALSALDQPGTPRFYRHGTPGNAGAAHVRLHQATRDAGIRLRKGQNAGLTDAELLHRYQQAYSDPRLNGIRGDLRTPDGSAIIARDVSPADAIAALLRWANLP